MRVKSEAQDQSKEDMRILQTVIALQAWLAIAILVVVAWQELALPKAEDRVACLRRFGSAMSDAYPGAWYSWWQPMVDQISLSMASFLCETYSYFQVCGPDNQMLQQRPSGSGSMLFPQLRSLPPPRPRPKTYPPSPSFFQGMFAPVLLLLTSVVYYYVVTLFPWPVSTILGMITLLTFAPGFASTIAASLPVLLIPGVLHFAWFITSHQVTIGTEMSALNIQRNAPRNASEAAEADVHRKLQALEAEQTWMWKGIPLRFYVRVLVHPALSLWLAVECGLCLARGFGLLL
jgi:hypothetical protein